jgi:hypothetical protein
MYGIRALLKTHRFTATSAGAAIGLNKAQSNRRANGDGPWSADELIRLYDYLKTQGADVRLGDLTRAAAADWRRSHEG